MYRLTLRALPLALLLAVVAGCDDDTSTPVSPTPDPVTETFTGSLNVNGGATHTFTSVAAGAMNATLTSLSPDSAAVLGFAIGTWNGTYCSHINAKDDATQLSVLYGTVTLSNASLCIRVYDVGRLPGPIDYTIVVVHP